MDYVFYGFLPTNFRENPAQKSSNPTSFHYTDRTDGRLIRMIDDCGRYGIELSLLSVGRIHFIFSLLMILDPMNTQLAPANH